MANEIQKPDPRALAKLLRIMLGPEEEWDDTAAGLVLELHGINSDEAPARLVKMIEREIRNRERRGEDIPSSFREVLSGLRSEHQVSEGLREPKARMEQMFIVGTVPLDSSSSQVTQMFHRRAKKLSKHDEDILKELSDELISIPRSNRRVHHGARTERLMGGSASLSASPADFAQALVQFLDLQAPFELDNRILLEIGLDLRDVPALGFDGALLRRPGEARGIIAVRDTIPERGSRKFTIAHEIGHYVMPGHDVDCSVCRAEDVGVLKTRVAKIEQAANEFAAEFLLPAREVKKILNQRGTSMATCKFISKKFRTSLTAAAVRCVELTDSTAAVIESRKGVRWRFRRSDRWKYFLKTGEPLGSKSLAKYLSPQGEKEKEGRVPVWTWVWTEQTWELYEHSILMPQYDSILTFLTEP